MGDVQKSMVKGYSGPMNATWNAVPQHTHLHVSACGTKFIDRDSRGWKLHTPALGRWTYFPTLEAAKAAA